MVFLNKFYFVICIAAVYAKPNIQSRIIGGDNAALEQFRHHASLQYSRLSLPDWIPLPELTEPSHICGASVISAAFVVLAAHCVCPGYISQITSLIPNPDIKMATCNIVERNRLSIVINTIIWNQGGNRYGVAKIIQHPGYNSMTIANDISLMKVTPEIPIPVPAIPIWMGEPEDESDVVAVGFGLTSAGNNTLPNELRWVTLTKMALSDCQSAYQNVQASLTSNNTCTKNVVGKGTCNGDSGGGLIFNGKLIGIVSYGVAPCGGGTYPDVYTKPSAHKDFIEEISDVLLVP